MDGGDIPPPLSRRRSVDHRSCPPRKRTSPPCSICSSSSARPASCVNELQNRPEWAHIPLAALARLQQTTRRPECIMGNDVEAIGSRSLDDAPAAWRPALGAWMEGDAGRFRVWAPAARSIDLVMAGGDAPPQPLARGDHGYWELRVADVRAGDRYWYRIDGNRTLPDPASRFQPEGVHGPSEVIDPKAFAWTDLGWMGTSLEHLIIYELHVGTFSPAGTFAGAAARLDEVARLGVTAIEVMPVAEFAGARNWGYDGVDLFAPSRGLWHTRRPARARGRRARAGARRDSRCRLQPPRAGGCVPHRVLSRLLHRTASEPVGRRRKPRR